jgi:hypothetical protein
MQGGGSGANNYISGAGSGAGAMGYAGADFNMGNYKLPSISNR